MIKWFLALFKSFKTVEELADWCKDNPILLGFWLSNRIRYVSDEKPEDEFRQPQLTLNTLEGDCDDVSVLAYAVLEKWGIKPQIIGIYQNMFAHSICMFEWNNKWCIIDNGGFQSFKVQTIRQCIERVYPNWTTISEHELNGKVKSVTTRSI